MSGTKFEFVRQVVEWSRPPVAGCNMDPCSFIGFSDSDLIRWTLDHWHIHYGGPGNWNGLMVDALKLDSTRDKTIIDIGCGFGFDALCYCMSGNRVVLADIVPANIDFASRLITIHGYGRPTVTLIGNEPPWWEWSGPLDIVHANGSLHHTPNIGLMLKRACQDLVPGGEVRLMLYTEELFRVATGRYAKRVHACDEPMDAYLKFLRYADAVGHYVDWYSEAKLLDVLIEHKVPLTLESWTFLRQDRGYAVAILRKE